MPPPKAHPLRKRRLSLPDLCVLTVVYALDFALLAGENAGLFLLASWAFFVINLAFIILYVPRGWDAIFLIVLVVSSLAVVLFGAPVAPVQFGSGSLQHW